MPTEKTLASVCETNPSLQLLRQKYCSYAVEVAHRVFQDEYALGAPVDRFLRICEAVRSEFLLRDTGDNYVKNAEEQLEYWCDRSKGEPWFSIQDNLSSGKTVSLRAAAGEVLKIVREREDTVDSISSLSLGDFLDGITDAAAHLRQDQASMITRLKAERDSIDRKIAEIETRGVTIATEEDKQYYAHKLIGTIRAISTNIGQLPTYLRENLAEATDLFYTVDDSHGQVIKAVIQCFTGARERPAYRAMQHLGNIHLDEARRQHLEAAVETILQHCGAYITANAKAEARNLFENFTDLSLRTVAEDAQATHRLSSFLDDSAFERRMGQSRRLLKLAETMRELARTESLSLSPAGLPFSGFALDHEMIAKRCWYDLRVTDTRPGLSETPPVIAAVNEIDPLTARTAVQAAAEIEAHLDPNRLKRRIGAITERFDGVALSSFLKNSPPKYGVDEIARYLQLAMEKLPAIFHPGWEFEILLPSVGDPSLSKVVRCADPVFLRSGKPGQGLETIKDLDARGLISPAQTDGTALSPEQPIRLWRATPVAA